MNDEERVIICQREIRRLRNVIRACEDERTRLLKYLQDNISKEELSNDVRKAFSEVYAFVTQE